MKNKVISNSTWANLFAIKNYTDFIQEWLDLYDAFFASNPKIDHKLEMDCMRKLLYVFGCKVIGKCVINDDYVSIKDDLSSLDILIDKEINPYE